MSETPAPSAMTARDLIDAAERGSGGGDRIARAAAFSDGWFAITLGLLIASFLLAVEYVFPIKNAVLSWGTAAAFSAAVVLVVLWNQRRRRASRTGWSKRYPVAFMATMTFYAVGVALSVSDQPDSFAFWLPYALLTAAPLVIAAIVNGRK